MSKTALIGSWRLTAGELVSADGNVRDMHAKPVGRLSYDANGYMTAQTMSAERSPYASGNPLAATAQELGLGAANVVSYYGTYEVLEAENLILHHLEMAALPNWIGSTQRRYFELAGDRLVLSAPLDAETVRLSWIRMV